RAGVGLEAGPPLAAARGSELEVGREVRDPAQGEARRDREVDPAGRLPRDVGAQLERRVRVVAGRDKRRVTEQVVVRRRGDRRAERERERGENRGSEGKPEDLHRTISFTPHAERYAKSITRQAGEV